MSKHTPNAASLGAFIAASATRDYSRRRARCRPPVLRRLARRHHRRGRRGCRPHRPRPRCQNRRAGPLHGPVRRDRRRRHRCSRQRHARPLPRLRRHARRLQHAHERTRVGRDARRRRSAGRSGRRKCSAPSSPVSRPPRISASAWDAADRTRLARDRHLRTHWLGRSSSRAPSPSIASARCTRWRSPRRRPAASPARSAPWPSPSTPAKLRAMACSPPSLRRPASSRRPAVLEPGGGLEQRARPGWRRPSSNRRSVRAWQILANSFKPYAACHLVHPAVDAARSALLPLANIRRVRASCLAARHADDRPYRCPPRDLPRRQVRPALLRGAGASRSPAFGRAIFSSPGASRTPSRQLPRWSSRSQIRRSAIAAARLDVEHNDGRTSTHEIATAKGHPGNPVSVGRHVGEIQRPRVSRASARETETLFAARPQPRARQPSAPRSRPSGRR